MRAHRAPGFILLVSLLAITFTITAQASWVDVGGAVNVDPNESAINPSMTGRGNTPYITFSELSGGTRHVFVKHWNGSDWEQDGGALNMDTNLHAFTGTIASINNGSPWVAFRENESPWKVYVKAFNGTSWGSAGSYLNVDGNREANEPHVIGAGNTPYVVWHEYAVSPAGRRLWAKYWNGSTWNQQGGVLNVDTNMSANICHVTVYNGTPWVTWREYTSTANSYIWVKFWNGSDWERVGATGVHNDHTKDPKNPSIAFQGSTPFVSWKERVDVGMNKDQLFAKYWNGTNWVQAGGSLLLDGNSDYYWPHLVASQGSVYACWGEEDMSGTARLHVKMWAGQQWNLVGQDLGTAGDAYYSNLADVNGTLYVSFGDGDSGTVHVKKYLTPTPFIPPTPSPTPTVTPTSALSQVDLDGKKALAYPVPATDQVSFLLQLDEAANVVIHIHNSAGERVAELAESLPRGGGQVMVWDCSDAGPGTYFVRVMMNDKLEQKLKVAVVKK